MAHKHGGGWKGGWGGGYPPYGYGYGMPWQAPATEVFVVDDPDRAAQKRAMAYIFSLPKRQQAAAYKELFGTDLKDAPGMKGRQMNGLSGYGAMRYPYQNIGDHLSWRDGPPVPFQSHAADAASLGSLGSGGRGNAALGIFSRPTLELPRPGSPEVLEPGTGSMAGTDCGCGCRGSGKCKPPLGDIDIASLAKPAAVIAGAYLLYKHFKKKRR